MLSPKLKPVAIIYTVLFCCSIILSTAASAAQLYRYKDDQGNYVLNQTIPPKYVKKGYDILNKQGRVIRRVAPELTAEQISARDLALEKERLRKIEAEKQAAIDSELKQLYSHPNEAVRVLSRRIIDIQALTQIKKNKISAHQNEIIEEEANAASRQRRGLKIFDSTFKKIDKLKSDIAISEHDITELENELSKVKAEFDTKIRRLEKITGKKASDYDKLLQDLKNNKPLASQDSKQEQ